MSMMKGVHSVAIVAEGTIDGEKLNAWMTELLRTQGTDIFENERNFKY